jgi:CDGSH-type Zn-finger protein
MFNISQ